MSPMLAVYTPTIGAPSETFIRRHYCDLLPGRTAILTEYINNHNIAELNINQPTLVLAKIHNDLIRRKILEALSSKENALAITRTSAARKFLLKNNVKVLLSEYLPPSLEWIDLCNDLGIKIFAHAHGYDVSDGYLRDATRRESYLALNQVDGIITVNYISKASLEKIGLDPKKIIIIPCGVDVSEVPYHRQPTKEPRCLAVGRMIGKKAPILLLDAFRRVVEIKPNVHLDYVGGGELLSAVYQYIQAFNLHKNVKIHGFQPNEFVLDLMKKTDIFIQHSITDPVTGDQEGLPVAILEAMAYCLPIVSTFHTGIPEAVKHEETGYLVDEGDSAMMANYIVKLVEDYELRIDMGKKGWEQVKQNFSWEIEKSKLLNVLVADRF